jgi:hypothetical protein
LMDQSLWHKKQIVTLADFEAPRLSSRVFNWMKGSAAIS